MKTADIAGIIDCSHSMLGEEIISYKYPWKILSVLRDLICEYGDGLSTVEYDREDTDIWIHKKSKIAKSAYLKGPLIIEEGAEIRHCAYIRGGVLIGKNAVVGNSTEIKNSILFDEVQAPHYNYIGDSLLGYRVHLGAGVILSNLRLDKENIIVKTEDEQIDTGLRKMGAIIGDFSEIGCGSVINPGRILMKNTIVLPLSSV